MTAPPDDCLARNEWICGAYLTSRRRILVDAGVQPLQLTAVSVLIGLALALPPAVPARRRGRAAGPVLEVTAILYTVPSLAMFSLLLPVYGLSVSLVVAGLVLYSPTLLVRNILAGLRITTVSAVSLVTVGAIVGFGGLGNLVYAGMNTYLKAQVLTASVLCVLIAIAADVLLLAVRRLITPWTRAARE
ncbi:ABC transporter permease [Streptomyces sp. CA-249302]|uniref:ABC transporter permease n=1 Tax=Streptomyces sp. CA-249302 TaxID=3240058 RepID=UPI003D8C8AEC